MDGGLKGSKILLRWEGEILISEVQLSRVHKLGAMNAVCPCKVTPFPAVPYWCSARQLSLPSANKKLTIIGEHSAPDRLMVITSIGNAGRRSTQLID